MSHPNTVTMVPVTSPVTAPLWSHSIINLSPGAVHKNTRGAPFGIKILILAQGGPCRPLSSNTSWPSRHPNYSTLWSPKRKNNTRTVKATTWTIRTSCDARHGINKQEISRQAGAQQRSLFITSLLARVNLSRDHDHSFVLFFIEELTPSPQSSPQSFHYFTVSYEIWWVKNSL